MPANGSILRTVSSTAPPALTLTSNQTGAGLNGNTVTFTVTPTTTYYDVFFNASVDTWSFNFLGGATTPTTVFTYNLTFNDGGGLTELVNPTTDIAGTVANAFWVLPGGATEPVIDNTQFVGTVSGIRFITTSSGTNQLLQLDADSLSCFARGTAIATPKGSAAVQDLSIGDAILTADGETRAVKWFGRQTLSTTFGIPDHLRPVRIAAGALGAGLPVRDLVLTADHALLIDELLVNAGALVNGTTITFERTDRLPPEFTVYHIETEDHAVILAEGTPAETFIDYAGRQQFDNAQEYLDLYGVEPIIPEMPRLRVSSRRQLPASLCKRFGIADYAEDVTSDALAFLEQDRVA